MAKEFTLVLLVLSLFLAACGSAESVIPIEELPPNGDAARGEVLYGQQIGITPACNSCHVEEATGAPTLDDLDDYAEVAGSRVEGQDARTYTFYSIAEPGQYIVEGYGNAMYDKYDENLTPQQIADLIAYLLSE